MSAPATGESLRELIREIPDFPRPGIGFKDITPLLADPRRARGRRAGPGRACPAAAGRLRGRRRRRGAFCSGRRWPLELGAGFVLARKPGKLPYETISAEYLLEYGAGQLELHTDAVHSGQAGAGTRRSAGHGRDRARRCASWSRSSEARSSGAGFWSSSPSSTVASGWLRRCARAAHLRVLGLRRCPPRVAAARSPRPWRSCGR